MTTTCSDSILAMPAKRSIAPPPIKSSPVLSSPLKYVEITNPNPLWSFIKQPQTRQKCPFSKWNAPEPGEKTCVSIQVRPVHRNPMCVRNYQQKPGKTKFLLFFDAIAVHPSPLATSVQPRRRRFGRQAGRRSSVGHQTENHQKMPKIKPNQSPSECPF